jgi:hypothetical protein
VTRRRRSVEINGARYPRFGWSRCERCQHYTLLYYVTPATPGAAWCRPCLVTQTHLKLPSKCVRTA